MRKLLSCNRKLSFYVTTAQRIRTEFSLDRDSDKSSKPKVKQEAFNYVSVVPNFESVSDSHRNRRFPVQLLIDLQWQQSSQTRTFLKIFCRSKNAASSCNSNAQLSVFKFTDLSSNPHLRSWSVSWSKEWNQGYKRMKWASFKGQKDGGWHKKVKTLVSIPVQYIIKWQTEEHNAKIKKDNKKMTI